MNYVVGITSRENGILSTENTLRQYFLSKKISHDTIVTMEQIHDVLIASVQSSAPYMRLDGVDGVYITGAHIETSIVLTVRVADCVPLFFVDEKNQNFGVVHAGWKGAIQHIAARMIRTFINNGSSSQDIKMFIGPHICAKCYSISKERANRFINEGFSDAVSSFGNEYHLDLGSIVLQDVQQALGNPLYCFQSIRDVNGMCTKCHSDYYFSYRDSCEKKSSLTGHNIGFLAISRYN